MGFCLGVAFTRDIPLTPVLSGVTCTTRVFPCTIDMLTHSLDSVL